MNRRTIGNIAWLIYTAFIISWVFVFPRFFPQIGNFGFFFPFFFFFPFLRRRGGRRTQQRPSTAKSSDGSKAEEPDYMYESMLADSASTSSFSTRNYLLYVIGALIIVVGLVLAFTHIL